MNQSPLPMNEKVTSPNGLMTRAWVMFLQSLRLTTTSGVDDQAIMESTRENRGYGQEIQETQIAAPVPVDYEGRILDLERRTTELASRYDGEIADLTAALANVVIPIQEDRIQILEVVNALARATKGIDTTDDLIVDLATKGLVLKDTQATPHYWRVTVDNAGALVISDVGTAKP